MTIRLTVSPEVPMRAVPRTAEVFNFQLVMTQLSKGSEEAARQVHDRYTRYVLQVVRRRSNKRLQCRFDAVDFAQEVWASFFALPAERFLGFENEQELLRFLARLALNKVIDRYRQCLATQKYDLSREMALGAREPEASRCTMPEELAIAKEEWYSFLQRFPDRQQAILCLLRDNCCQSEIAQKLAVNEKTVRRFLQQTKESARRIWSKKHQSV